MEAMARRLVAVKCMLSVVSVRRGWYKYCVVLCGMLMWVDVERG